MRSSVWHTPNRLASRCQRRLRYLKSELPLQVLALFRQNFDRIRSQIYFDRRTRAESHIAKHIRLDDGSTSVEPNNTLTRVDCHLSPISSNHRLQQVIQPGALIARLRLRCESFLDSL